MARIRVANAPCSWGVLEFDAEKKAGFGQVLDEMKASGYAGTELGDWGFMPAEPARLKDELGRRALSMVGAFVPVAMADPATHASGAELAVRTARLLAAVGERPFIVLADDNGKVPERTRNAGRIVEGQGLSAEAWRVFARGVEHVARAVKDATGLRTVVHHHCGGYVETPKELETLLSLTDPALVGLCLDMGHAAFGGGDPLAMLDRWRERIWHVHFKDCEPAVARLSREKGWDYLQSVAAGVFCELGRGTVPFKAIVESLRGAGYDGWVVVEQDVLAGMGSPLESARRNRGFLATLGL